MRLRRAVLSAMFVSATLPVRAEPPAQAYVPPGGAALLQPLARANPKTAQRYAPRDLMRSGCVADSLVEIGLGGQVLRVPAKHLVSVVTEVTPQMSDGCPGYPIAALATSLLLGGEGPPIVIEGSPSSSAFISPVMYLKNSAWCATQVNGLAACKLPGQTEISFYIDRSGPVDVFENPPVASAGKGSSPYVMPYTHPSGLFAMMFMPASEPIDVKRVRGARLHMEFALSLYLVRPWKARYYDPGQLPVQDFDRPGDGIVGYQVDAKNWTTARALELRSCPDAKTAEFQVGPVRFTVPLAQVRGFQAAVTAMTLASNRKAFEASASCPGQPLQVGGFRAEVEGRTVEVNGRGQNVQAQIEPHMQRIVDTGSCSDTADGPRFCELRTPEATQGVYRLEDKDFPVSVMCITPKGDHKGCMLAAEVELGFSYAVNVPEKPSAGTNWAAEVKRMPDLIRTFSPTPAQPAKLTAGRAL